MTTVVELKNLHCVVEAPSGKFLCFSRVEQDTVTVCTTDGYTLWRLELNPAELEAHRELADIHMDAYLSRIKSSFESGDLKVSESGVRCTLDISHGTKFLSFELYEAKAVERKTELHDILFLLADKSKDLETKLEKANSTLNNLRQQKKSAEVGGSKNMFDLGDARKGKSQPKSAPKQTGMSVINPGSKKRKAAKGVDFDD